MANYRISPNAKDDLERIWRYGVDRWGMEAADAYHATFFDHSSFHGHAWQFVHALPVDGLLGVQKVWAFASPRAAQSDPGAGQGNHPHQPSQWKARAFSLIAALGMKSRTRRFIEHRRFHPTPACLADIVVAGSAAIGDHGFGRTLIVGLARIQYRPIQRSIGGIAVFDVVGHRLSSHLFNGFGRLV